MRVTKTRGILRLCAAVALPTLLVVGLAASVRAEGASSISQGFQTTDRNVVAGAIVGLKKGTPNSVELATSATLDQMLGVVGNESLIELSGGVSSVPIVTNGKAVALVSDLNGSVKTGDKITASPIAGVGMKATESTLIIGTAQSNLSSADTESRSITDKGGDQKTVHIGAIPIQVDKVYYDAPQQENSFLPPAFQDFANRVAGRQVSPVRVMIAGMLVLLLFVTVAILLYSAVRASIISIGRNPLSEKAVQKSLWQVGLTVLGVMVFTVVIIYFILTT
jgi:hypothetical protein